MPHNFGEGIEPGMRFSPMKIVEGKCASKYCEVISAEKLPDLSDAQALNLAFAFVALSAIEAARSVDISFPFH